MNKKEIIKILDDTRNHFNEQVEIEWTEQNLSDDQDTYLWGYNQAIRDIKNKLTK